MWIAVLVAVTAVVGFIAVRWIRSKDKAPWTRGGAPGTIFDLDRPPDPATSAAPSWRTSRGERSPDPNLKWDVDEFIEQMERVVKQKATDDQE